MLRFESQLINADKVLQKLQRLAVLDGVGEAHDDGARLLIADLQEYPPERPGQRYQRTFKLQRGWRRSQVQKRARAWSITISNGQSYAPYVVGTRDQADVHRGRWKTIKQRNEDKRGAIKSLIGHAVRAAWRT